MRDLSVLIPARNEEFLARTIEDVLAHAEADTEVIAVLDGAWPDPPIPQHERVTLIYHPKAIGQRAATNEATRVSTAKYVMKLDAHCSVAQGFDVALMAQCEREWTVFPLHRNLHAFDWQCKTCGNRTYQGGKPKECAKCGPAEFERVMVWQPKSGVRVTAMRFDSELHFQYFPELKARQQWQDNIADTMSLLGACWMMTRERYWELEGLDEAVGSWGQMGTEIACKAWLSGGRLVCNRSTWFAHLFRTQDGFGFPYPLSGSAVDRARKYSQAMWRGNAWPKQIHPLSWLVEKFAPVPGWSEDAIADQRAREKSHAQEKLDRRDHTRSAGGDLPRAIPVPIGLGHRERAAASLTVGLVYYTDNVIDARLATVVRRYLAEACNGHEVVTVSREPLGFIRNIVVEGERGVLTMFRQILAGLEYSTADVIFFAEHDVLYAPGYFDFRPPDPGRVYYNLNIWNLRLGDGHCVYWDAKRTSQLCAYRQVLLGHYRERVARVESQGWSQRIGFEPGSHGRAERLDDLQSATWVATYPNVDIKHGQNLTPARWRTDQFRSQRSCRNWQEADAIPYWGDGRALAQSLQGAEVSA